MCSVRGHLWVGGITNDVVMPPTQRWPHSEPFFLPAAAKKHLRRCKSMEMRRSCGQGRSLGAPRGPSASYSHRSTTSYHEVDTSTALDRMAAPVDLRPAMRDVRLTPFCQDDRRFAKAKTCGRRHSQRMAEDGHSPLNSEKVPGENRSESHLLRQRGVAAHPWSPHV